MPSRPCCYKPIKKAPRSGLFGRPCGCLPCLLKQLNCIHLEPCDEASKGGQRDVVRAGLDALEESQWHLTLTSRLFLRPALRGSKVADI